MLGAFALFALLLASVGVYGVMSYPVTESRHDIGLRVALGARPGDIIRLVVSQGMALAAAGMFVGLAGATALTQWMSSLLFGIRATDVATFGSVTAILAATAFLATVIPAFRATHVDPILALREE
jgi:ABC-type antimicrobial peptide transport system permease subunit